MSSKNRIFGSLSLLTLIVLAGCQPPADPLSDMAVVNLRKTKVNDIARTMDFIFAEVRFSQKEFRDQLSTGLNRWVSYSDEKLQAVSWKPDSLSAPLLEKYQSLSTVQRNGEYDFLNTDAYYLQEIAWVAKIVDRVTQSKKLNAFEFFRVAADNYKPDDDVAAPLTEVIKKLHPDLNDDDAEKLAISLKLFDWVVRNIQLLPELDLTDEQVEDEALRDGETPADSGVRGLGYQRYGWQLLLYGRGDYVERAKLLMMCLRQAGLDSVLLATKNKDGQPKPWAVAVAINDQYYLFDTKLAFPVPGKQLGSIATLADVRANPDLISSLDLTTEESLEENTDYWVKPAELSDLEALVYVTPESISKRMLGLQSSLVGESRLPLVFTADEVAARLPSTDGLNVIAWDIAFKTHQFRQAVREALEQTSSNQLSEKLRWHYTDESYIDDFVIYRTARVRFINGKFNSEVNATRLNAVESFQRLMYSDETIARLGNDPNLQHLMGIRKFKDQDAALFDARVNSVQSQMRLIRRDAGIFLSQCLFDNGSVNAAGNWLEDLRDQDDSQRWNDGIIYLLGRSLEGRKEYDKAIEVLSDTKSTQSHGNLIRARKLKELVAKYY